jgi:hypothetical protein
VTPEKIQDLNRKIDELLEADPLSEVELKNMERDAIRVLADVDGMPPTVQRQFADLACLIMRMSAEIQRSRKARLGESS